MAAVTLCKPKPMALLFLDDVLEGLACCSCAACSMVRLLALAALSNCPMMDFLMANFFTLSGGLVVSLSYAT